MSRLRVRAWINRFSALRVIIGAEGLSVNASNFLIEDLALEDTIGDALKVNEGDNITIRRVRTEWTNGPDTDNGSYGIYPVQTTNVLLEGNVAIGASDAGIYVGQSRQVIVRNNQPNVMWRALRLRTLSAQTFITILLTTTPAAFWYSTPSIPQRSYGTRVFDNDIHSNNTKVLPGNRYPACPPALV